MTDNGIPTRNLDQYAALHRTQTYGVSGRKRRKLVEPLIRPLKPKTILDYGAGQSTLVDELQCPSLVTRHRFDPAIPEISTIPLQTYDVVLCTDVLEHLDEQEIVSLVKHITQYSKAAVFCVHCGTAKTVLPNGENAHATVKSPEWWRDQIGLVFPAASIVSFEEAVVTVKTFDTPLRYRIRDVFRKLRSPAASKSKHKKSHDRELKRNIEAFRQQKYASELEPRLDHLQAATPSEMIEYAAMFALTGRYTLAQEVFKRAVSLDPQVYRTRYLGLTASLSWQDPKLAERFAADVRAFDYLHKFSGTFEKLILDNRDSICVVGNSDAAKGSRRGSEIDGHGLIIRFNNFSTAPTYADDYGTRCDVWIRTPGYRNIIRRPGFSPTLAVCPASLSWRIANGQNTALEYLVRGEPLQECPDHILSQTAQACGGLPSSGLVILNWIEAVLGSLTGVTVAGFTLNDQPNGSRHYFQALPRRKAAPHNWHQERAVLDRMLASAKLSA